MRTISASDKTISHYHQDRSACATLPALVVWLLDGQPVHRAK